MPYRLPKPCAAAGCPALTHERFCPAHQRADWRRINAGRSSEQRGRYGARHGRWRKLVLAEHPICGDGKEGCRAPSTVADHIVPLEEGGGWELENGMGMCKPCHDRKTMREMKRRGVAR